MPTIKRRTDEYQFMNIALLKVKFGDQGNNLTLHAVQKDNNIEVFFISKNDRLEGKIFTR